jgi:hypothetical protein
VLVPSDFERWSLAEQRVALAHEIAHLQRRDSVTRCLADLLCAFLWFHPLVWRIRRQFILAQELSADAAAAQSIGSISQYKHDLSMLLLRTDSQSSSSMCFEGVFISTNDVVRRIQMLDSIQFSVRRSQVLWAVTAFVVVASGALGWHVNADEPQQTKDVPRVASRQPGVPNALPSGEFSAQDSPPWDHLGRVAGYLQVKPSEFYRNSLAAAFLPRPMLLITQNTSGDLDDKITLWQSSIDVSCTELPEAERSEGHTKAVHMMMSAFHIRTVEPIDWAKVANQIDWSALGMDLVADHVKQKIVDFGKTDEVSLQVEKENPRTTDEEQAVLACLWNLIDGGAAAILIKNPVTSELIPEAYRGNASFRVLGMISHVGIGLDVGEDPNEIAYRILCFPNDESRAEAIVELWPDVIGEFRDAVDSPSVEMISWLPERAVDRIAASVPTTVATSEGTAVLVTGHLNTERLLQPATNK